MAYKVKKHCRVCGKLYTPCADCENDNVAFHWRTVACSYDCGLEYFKRIMESRNVNPKNAETTISKSDESCITDKQTIAKARTTVKQSKKPTSSKNKGKTDNSIVMDNEG